MQIEALRVKIEHAFDATPYPGDEFEDISATHVDEGIVGYFRSTSWRSHQVSSLRYHSAALSFFTDKAFRYWLPAFMLAELENPEEADIIAEHIAHDFSDAHNGRERLLVFSLIELRAISAFLRHCENLYDMPGLHTFGTAVKIVEQYIGGLDISCQ